VWSTGDQPWDVLAADVNRDGLADLVTADRSSKTLSLFYSDGEGGFLSRVDLSVGAAIGEVVTGDLNTDGHLDVATTGDGYGGVVVFLSDGAGSYLPPSLMSTNALCRGYLCMADVNGDDHLDLISTCKASGNEIAVLRGNGAGGFEDPRYYRPGTTGDWPHMVAAGDFNGDGHVDLATVVGSSTNPDTAAVLLNDGSGDFPSYAQYYVRAYAQVLVSADVTGDGCLDLATLSSSQQYVSLLAGRGDGTFEDRVDTAVKGAGLVSADVNRDGQLDLATLVSVGSRKAVCALLGGQVPLAPVMSAPLPGSGAYRLALADFDGDGLLDLAATWPSSDALMVLGGRGPLEFEPRELAVGANPGVVFTGDFNHDGASDVALADRNNKLSILLGIGDGTFRVADAYSLTHDAVAMSGVDFNGDGHLDLFVTGYVAQYSTVLLGRGDGTFVAKPPFSAVGGPRSSCTADFDDDGRMDVALGGHSQALVVVLRGNGDGTFAAPVSYSVGGRISAIVAADLNGDGHPDLAANMPSQSALAILLGRDNGTLADAYNVSTGPQYATGLVSGDFNGDGHADLAARTQLNFVVLQGVGDGTFPAYVYYPSGLGEESGPQDVTAGDFDGDGRLDLVSANSETDSVSVLLGRADGTFGPSLEFAVGEWPKALTAADFDRDGALDLVTANEAGESVSLLFSNARWTSVIESPVRSGAILAGDTLRFAGYGRARRQPASYLWDLGLGRTSLLEDPGLVTFTQPGTLAVRFAVSDRRGAADSSPDSRTITVVPDTGFVPDLAVTSIGAPAELPVGQSVTVRYRVANQGDADLSAVTWTDAMYLSDDPYLDARDMLLTHVERTAADLAKGQSREFTAEITAPPGMATGSCYLIVSVDDGWEVLERHQLNNESTVEVGVDIPWLVDGVLAPGSFSLASKARYYRIDVTDGSHLLVGLNDADDQGVNELYLRRGGPPSRTTFDYRSTGAGLADQQVFVSDPAPGTWYVLAYGSLISADGEYTIVADLSELALASSTPGRHGTTTAATLVLAGAGFDDTVTVALVAGDATTYPASSVSVDSSTQLRATFALGSVPPGVYAVRVVKPGGLTAELPGALDLVAGGEAVLETNLVLPAEVGYHQLATIYVEYANTGDLAMPAPLLVLDAVQNGAAGAIMTLDRSRVTQGLWTSAVPDGFSTSVHILASGGTPGLLFPGESIRVPVYYVGWLKPWDMAYPPIEFSLSATTADSAILIDWAAQKDSLRPDWLEPEAWEPVWANFVGQVGNTWGDYVAMLDDNAAYFGRLGQQIANVSELLGFELRQADGLSPHGYLAMGVDVSAPAPGLPLVFLRSFVQNINRRYELGPLGRGWRHSWQMLLQQEPDGTVTIEDMAGNVRTFQPDSRGGYLASSGESAILSALSEGAFLLREAGGLQYAFRSDGCLEYVADLNGNRITATYAEGRLTALAHSCGAAIQIHYNAAGRIDWITDPNGDSTLFSYDAGNEHLLAVQEPSGRTTRYMYSTGQGIQSEHALTQVEFPTGDHQFFTYDERGRLSEAFRDGYAEGLAYTYDSAGTVSETNASGATFKYSFDNRAALLKVENPLGNIVSYTPASTPNAWQRTDPDGGQYTFEYDGGGDLVAMTDVLGESTALVRNSLGLVTSLADANGNTTTFGYDARGNLASITYPDATEEEYAYDDAGNCIRYTNRRGASVEYSYDAQGRLTERRYPDGSHVDYAYDPRGNLLSTSDKSGTTTYHYEDNGWLAQIDYPGGRCLTFSYDAAGRRTSSTDQLGHVVNYHYDALNRLERLTDAADAETVRYSYDPAGRLAGVEFANGVYTTYEYDLAGRVLHLVNYAHDDSVLSRFDYTYDAVGERVGMAILDGQWSFQYDPLGRLVRAVFDSTNVAVPDQDLSYEYDPLGNRVRTVLNGQTTEYAVNTLNQYAAIGETACQYDADGNLVLQVSTGGATHYSYDEENRLIAMKSPSGSWQYIYDALGNRVQVVENGATTYSVIDPLGLGNLVAQYDTAGELIAHYDYGLGLVSRSDADGNAAFYTFDVLGNTSDVTGPSGAVLNSYAYAPFGSWLHAAETVANPFQYAGQWGVIQEPSGLQFLRARFYDAVAGRFLSQDPSGVAGGQVNLYGYAFNNPVNFGDPSGRMPVPVVETPEDSAPDDVVSLDPIEFPLDPGPPDPPQPPAPPEPPGPPESPGPPSRPRDDPMEERPGVGTLWGPECKEVVSLLLAEILEGSGIKVTHGFTIMQEKNFCRWKGVGFVIPPPSPPGPGGGGGTGGAIDPVAPKDPNQKLGASGHGPARYVAPESPLVYRVDFENESSATAPAQYVTVSDQLDEDLDWGTFELAELGFGDYVIDVPPGSQLFQTVVPLSFAGRELEVHVEAGIDLETGLAVARFATLDPATGWPPEVSLGFLPPEDGTGRGQGFFSYLVDARPGLPTGTEIRNVAVIQFDFGETIATNQVDPHDPGQGVDPAKECLNTIDAGAPASSVIGLPETIHRPWFEVRWAGEDDPGGSGIASYDVYASVDGGQYFLLATNTQDTSKTTTVTAGHTYAFYSIATDNVGHREAAPATPDAQTTVPWVNDPPVAVSGGPYLVDLGQTLPLDAAASYEPNEPQGDLIVSYQWLVAGDVVLSGISPSLTAAQVDGLGLGTFPVELTVVDTFGDANTASTTVTICDNRPVANLSAAPTPAACNQMITFDGGGSYHGRPDRNIVLYEWDFDGDGTYDLSGASSTATHSYTCFGSYTATLRVTDDNTPPRTGIASLLIDFSLGTVDFLRLDDLSLAGGSVYYALETSHTGFLTLEVLAPEPPKSARIKLYDQDPFADPTPTPLVVSTLVDGNQRVDLVVGSGQTCYVEFFGDNPGFDVRIANLVHHSGTELTVFGTAEDDAFVFSASNPRSATINGVKYSFADADVVTVAFDGGQGYDRVSMHDSPGDDTLEAWSSDTAVFANSATDSVPDFTTAVHDYEEIHVYASPSPDDFDTATLYGTPGNDKFKAEPLENYAKLYGGAQYNRVKFFDWVDVYAGGAAQLASPADTGNDLARLWDSDGDDTFRGGRGLSEFSGPGFDIRLHDYRQVCAYGTNAGNDIATLVDSALKDELQAKPHKSEIFDMTTGGEVYKVTARAFSMVRGEASNTEGAAENGGRDKAKLWGTLWDDSVQAADDWLYYDFSKDGNLDRLYEILAFESVTVRTTPGGRDTKIVTDPLVYALLFDDGWETP
jgi:RHS repeat-associated protein